MITPLPLSNWSLKKALDTEPDNFTKARIRIVFTILIFSIAKVLVVVSLGAAGEQWRQVVRALVVLAVYMVLLKALLYRTSFLKPIAHIMVTVGVALIWTNIFVFAHKINLPTIQFVFMIMLSTFFTLGNKPGFIYSGVSILPVVLYIVLGGNGNIYLTNTPQEFASPGFEIVVVLNFVSILVAHYLFFKAININIREKEALNAQLQVSIAEANALAASRSNFLSTMSHELRTPLNSVIGIAELLLADRPEERQKDNLKILQLSAIDLLSLINNVLDFNKIESDKVVLEAVPLRVAEFMRNICAVLRVKANNKKLVLDLEIDEQLEHTNIITDPTRLSQVMYNLIGNAIKYTDKGSISVKVSQVKRADDVVDVLFTVADTGIGIPSDKHETIFELFAQARSQGTNKYGGTGLGLAIVKQILTLFNSTIELESSAGSGARFFFTITFPTTAASPVQKIAAPVDSTDLGHLKVLVAEDDHINRMVVTKQLSRLNIIPVIVDNGKKAFEAYLSGDFNVILLDLNMPVMDGYETIQQIRVLPDTRKAMVYMIAFTASVTERQKIADNGFNDFLYKPVSMTELREKLEKVPRDR